MTKTDPYNSVDDAARSLAKRLLEQATFAALAVLRPEAVAPTVSRIALATDEEGRPITLISDLSEHTRALLADPSCALLIGEPTDKGDPLTHPRLTLRATARFIARDTAEHEAMRRRYLNLHPKSRLYIDFTDFGFVRFDVRDGLLNGGFGKAYRLFASDLEN